MTQTSNKEQERILLGELIAQRRREAGLTQRQLAERANISQPHLARIETGRYGVTMDILTEIAEAMGCRIDLVRK